jgi:dethiobiotin synthetase
MTQSLIVIGTDTNVGKTVFAAALADALGAHYWKPVQAGLTLKTDSQTVAHLGGLSPDRIVPEVWRLPTPASPHIAARAAGIKIDVVALHPPQSVAHVIIETAGGVMVPLTEDFLTIDLLARWRLPTILVARTELGTINHSLLTLEALRHRDIAVKGVAFVGNDDAAAQQTIATVGGVRQLGRLPRLDPLNRDTLRAAFAAHFSMQDFLT